MGLVGWIKDFVAVCLAEALRLKRDGVLVWERQFDRLNMRVGGEDVCGHFVHRALYRGTIDPSGRRPRERLDDDRLDLVVRAIKIKRRTKGLPALLPHALDDRAEDAVGRRLKGRVRVVNVVFKSTLRRLHDKEIVDARRQISGTPARFDKGDNARLAIDAAGEAMRVWLALKRQPLPDSVLNVDVHLRG